MYFPSTKATHNSSIEKNLYDFILQLLAFFSGVKSFSGAATNIMIRQGNKYAFS